MFKVGDKVKAKEHLYRNSFWLLYNSKQDADKIHTVTHVSLSEQSVSTDGLLYWDINDFELVEKGLALENSETETKVCKNHEWLHYEGLVETYEFCKSCDTKNK